MASTTRSQSKGEEDPHGDFHNQGLIRNPEPCTLFDLDIKRLKSSNAFPSDAKFKTFDPSLRPDHCSDKWICFPEFPFTLGLSFPFPPLFENFFTTTGLSYAQTMPMVWRTLFVIQNLIDSHFLDLGIAELAYTYNLRSHGSSYFLFQVKPNRSHLVLRSTQNDPNWKTRYFFVERKSIPGGDLLPSLWVQKVKFSDLAPITEDTEGKVARFLEIPVEERTFHHPSRVDSAGSREIEPAMSGSQRSTSRFTLSELESDVVAKKEKISSGPSKSRIPNLRSSAKKRKSNEVILVDESSPLLGHEEAINNVHLAFGQVVKSLNDKISVIEDLKKIAESKTKLMEKEAAENVRLKKEVEDLKALRVKDAEDLKLLKADHSKEMDDLLDDIKRDAAIAIFEAKVKMFSEASAADFDISTWDIQSWRAKLVGLKGEDPEAEQAASVTMEVVKDLETAPPGDEGKVE